MVSLESRVAEIVERARQGDQNAMGTLREMKNAAGAGSSQAKRTVALAMKYMQENPFNRFGAECLCKNAIESCHGQEMLKHFPEVGDVWVCAVLLANSEDPNLLKKARAVGKSLQGRQRALFFYSMRNGRDRSAFHGMPLGENDQDVVNTGRAFHWAGALQKVRLPDTNISDFSRMAGWELGE